MPATPQDESETRPESNDPTPPADEELKSSPEAPKEEVDEYADADDAGRGEIIVYSLGGVIDEFTTSGFRNLNTLLLVAFQLNPLILGLITAIKSIWDGFMDPIVAHISDNCDSRFGRRRPFILAGGITMALVAWITWEFMPDNEKLRPNDPVVPEVHFADKDWKLFGKMLLAYGVEELNFNVEVEDREGAAIPAEMLQLFAEDSIKTLSSESKSLVRLTNANGQSESDDGDVPAADIPTYTFTFQTLEASEQLHTGPNGDAGTPFSGTLSVELSGPGLESPLRAEVHMETVPDTLTDLEREIPFLERMLYFFIGRPEEGGLRLKTDDVALEMNVLEHRAAERAVDSALQQGMMETLSQMKGLPYWRVLPETAVFSTESQEFIREQAEQRFLQEPEFLYMLMVSEGVTLNMNDGQLTEAEAERIAQFRARQGDLTDDLIFEKIYDGLDIETGAAYHAINRNPQAAREFSGIWEKIGDGLKAYTKADAAEERKFIWFIAAMFLLMAIGQTLYGAAYYAQGIEIAPSYNGRTLVVAYRSVANTLISFLTALFLPLSLMPMFYDAREGSLFLVYIFSPIGIILAFTVFFGTRERTVVIRDKNKKGPGFFKAIREIGGNLEFWRIALMYIFMGYAIGSFQGLGSFLAIYYVFEGNLVAGASYGALSGMIGTLVAFLSIPLYVYLCAKIGKHNTMRAALGLLALASSIKYFCYNPELPELMLIPAFLYSPAIAMFYKVLGSMMGDVTDYDELLNGERREGMFGAVMAIIMKSMGAFTALATGFVIVASGFEQAKGIHQDPGVFNRMLILFSVAPGLASLGGFAILYRFKLTEARIKEIKKMLAKQRREKAEKIESAS